MIFLDRYEGKDALIEEDGAIKKIEKNEIEGAIKEGSVLIFKDGKYFLDEAKTKARREKLIGLQNSLFD